MLYGPTLNGLIIIIMAWIKMKCIRVMENIKYVIKTELLNTMSVELQDHQMAASSIGSLYREQNAFSSGNPFFFFFFFYQPTFSKYTNGC